MRLADERAKIEDAAVLLPVTSARDAWQLLAMTVEPSNLDWLGDCTDFRPAPNRTDVATKVGGNFRGGHKAVWGRSLDHRAKS